MRILALVQLIVGIAHGVRLAAAEHHLEIGRRQRVVLETVNDAGRAGNAFPRSEPRGEPLAAFVLDEDIEKTLQHEETLLYLVGMRGVALAWLEIDDGEGEIAGRDNRRIVVLAGGAGADEAVLGALVAFDLGIGERRPIRLLVPEATDIFLHDLFERNAFELFGTRMPCDAHGRAP